MVQNKFNNMKGGRDRNAPQDAVAYHHKDEADIQIIEEQVQDLERMTKSKADERSMRALLSLPTRSAKEALQRVADLVRGQDWHCENLSSVLQSTSRKLERYVSKNKKDKDVSTQDAVPQWEQVPNSSRDQGGSRREQTPKLMPQPKGKAFGKGNGKAGQRQGQKGQGKAGRPTMDDREVIQGGKFAKNRKTSEQDRKRLEKMDHACKVWVGGLPDEVSIKEVIGFFELVGKPKVIDIRRKGTACVAFASEADALDAISTLNGSDLKGSSIQVDEWTKPERSERRGNEEEDDDAYDPYSA